MDKYTRTIERKVHCLSYNMFPMLNNIKKGHNLAYLDKLCKYSFFGFIFPKAQKTVRIDCVLVTIKDDLGQPLPPGIIRRCECYLGGSSSQVQGAGSLSSMRAHPRVPQVFLKAHKTSTFYILDRQIY